MTRLEHKRRVHENCRIRRMYGITLADFHQLAKDQHGCCAICDNPMIRSNEPHIDHCHETGRVRGLLCRACNIALGQLGDTEQSLKRVISYIQGWR